MPMEHIPDNGGVMGHEYMKKIPYVPSHPDYKMYFNHLGIDSGADRDFNDPDIEYGEIGEVEINESYISK